MRFGRVRQLKLSSELLNNRLWYLVLAVPERSSQIVIVPWRFPWHYLLPYDPTFDEE
jgi:hypothetical protein